ncbi:putative protein tyrosine phosphatase [Afipia massiliensis]|uniref:Tyrosine-protein phosphatase domain-containing protein n=2 Tax=Afipia massiliensis TaxID=211460 RepID=A0A840N4A8_9BRAD|nr:putative protein tyrosine phosphatase [Afipia massiliensis]
MAVNTRIAMIHVCSLAALPATVEATGAQHILTVMANVAQVVRPVSVLEANHLRIQMDDINEPALGFVAPSHEHVEQALAFIRKWDRTAPMVIHCYAGISRSTASAFMAACALNPNRDETSIARQIRAASPSAYPNRLIVTLADEVLGRGGRMVRALDAMGPGNMTIEGRPFRVDLE